MVLIAYGCYLISFLFSTLRAWLTKAAPASQSRWTRTQAVWLHFPSAEADSGCGAGLPGTYVPG